MNTIAFKSVNIFVLIGILLIPSLACKEEETPQQELDPQLIGKWRVRRGTRSKSTKVSSVNSLDIRQDSLSIRFTTGEGGVLRDHYYSGPHRFDAGDLILPDVASLRGISFKEGALYFSFDYHPDLSYFCAYLDWKIIHQHDTFYGIGTK